MITFLDNLLNPRVWARVIMVIVGGYLMWYALMNYDPVTQLAASMRHSARLGATG